MSTQAQRDFAKKLRLANQRVRVKPPTPQERIQAARKAKARAAKNSTGTPEGFTPAFKAKLLAAQRRMTEDPEVVAKLDRAALAKRIEMAKRESGITPGLKAPERFMGATENEVRRAAGLPIVTPPPSMAEIRAQTKMVEEPEQRRGKPRRKGT